MVEQTMTAEDTDNGTPQGAVADNTDTVSLQLSDLLPDSGGNVVIEYDGGNLAVELVTDQAVVDRGVATDVVDAHGGDLSGLAYCAFGDGTTIFFPTELSLHVLPIQVPTQG
jgi:hypothetical protein